MSMEDSDVSFKRRKFTITEPLDNVLENLANKNYQGNVSLCLRAAIEDHRKTINGTDSGLATQQLVQRINKLTTQQEQITDALNGLENSINQDSTGTDGASIRTKRLPNEATQILTALENEETGLRIDDFADGLDLTTARIQPTLGTLIDRGMIISDDGSPARFYLAGWSDHDIQGV